MLILKCPYPDENDMKGGEQLVNMQFAPTDGLILCSANLASQKGQPLDEIPSERARNWEKVSKASQI